MDEPCTMIAMIAVPSKHLPDQQFSSLWMGCLQKMLEVVLISWPWLSGLSPIDWLFSTWSGRDTFLRTYVTCVNMIIFDAIWWYMRISRISSNTGMAQISDRSRQPSSTKCLLEKNHEKPVVQQPPASRMGPRAPNWSICARHLEAGWNWNRMRSKVSNAKQSTALNAFHHVQCGKR